jgi:DNA-binding winged helix-turn-helix (wHTH) protein/tetratricopeptide (TPR) repeat protein
MSSLANGLIQFEEYEIDRARWQLSWRDAPVSLNRKTFDLLLYLLDHSDRVVGKDELLRALWPESFVEESNLTQHIFLLRKALSRHESGMKIIETVPGRGYRFAASIKQQQPATERMVINASESITRITLEEETDTLETASPEPEVFHPLLSPPSGRHRISWIVGGAVVAATLCVAGWFSWQRWLDRSGGAPVQVVLTPMEGTTGDAILDKSLTQALRMDLAQSPYVTMVPDSTVQATLTQMMHKPGEVMTPAMAREVCERTNSQGVLSGDIAKIGQHFLITEEASNCVDGSVVASAKYESEKPEDLPRSIDRIAASLRQKLGESRRSIARFGVPLFPGRTASLEALKYFTQGVLQSNQGKYVDAIDLMKKAVAADPEFAEAYYDLAAYYGSVLDLNAEREAILKAYNLRDSESEPVRLAIIALYHSAITQDLYEAERNYRNWTELYPRSGQAWNGLSVVERNLGHHQEALAAAERALELRPSVAGLYANLAYEQMTLGNPKGSFNTCEHALAKGMDVDYIREHCFQAAYALHDAALVQKQRAWAAAHPDAVYIRYDEILVAIAEGRFTDAVRLTRPLEAIMRQRGMTEPADDFIRNVGNNLIESGDVADGVRILRSVPVDPKDEMSVVGLAWAGDAVAAENAVHAMQTEFPQGTLWNDYRGPEVQAIIALSAHSPKDAIQALERARSLEGRDPVISMLRGDAYLAVGQFPQAEAAYRKVVDGLDQEPEAEEVPLSWLGLGRALGAEGKRVAAIDAYQHFFTLWVHADPDAMYFKRAKQELATLQTVPLDR